jgi:hypothetical protein
MTDEIREGQCRIVRTYIDQKVFGAPPIKPRETLQQFWNGEWRDVEITTADRGR